MKLLLAVVVVVGLGLFTHLFLKIIESLIYKYLWNF